MPDADLEFLDSYGHYDTATLYQKYETPNSGAIVPGAGRFGVQGLVVGFTNAGPIITFKRNPTSVYMGMAIKIASFTPENRNLIAAQSNGAAYATLYMRNDHRLEISTLRGRVATSFATVDFDTFYYFELKAVITTDTSIAIEARLNEVPVLNYTSPDPSTFLLDINNGDQWFTQASTIASICTCSDFYVQTARYLGDIKVRFIKPNGPGLFSDWNVFGAASDWQATNQVPPDGDTSYIYSHTAAEIGGDETLVAMEDVDLQGGTCEGIQFLVNCRKTDANIRALKPLVNEGGLTTEGAEFSMPTDYVYTHDCLDVNPRTGLKWTEPELDAIQQGAQLTI